VSGRLCNAFNFKTEERDNSKITLLIILWWWTPYCQYTVLQSTHLQSRPKSLAWPAGERTIVTIMIDKGVTNLSGKSLSKLIYCFLVMLIKVLSFSVNMVGIVKQQLMHVPGIFRMKSDLLNMFDLIKLYAIWWMISQASTMFHKHWVDRWHQYMILTDFIVTVI